jgi:pyruvate formate lyase activating enzyme
MLIAGVEKLTTLDFPGHVAAVVFTPGCNFRCGFCHNPHFVDVEKIRKRRDDLIPESAFFNFLEERKGLLEGVCISGGEPTLQPDLLDFCKKIKEKSFLVKVDTNGSNSKVVEELIKSGVVDYFAMDIKTSPGRYREVAGPMVDVDEVKKSKELIQSAATSGIPYEFRSTAIKELHTLEVFHEIGEWIKGAENYYLQNFRNKVVLDESYKQFSGFSEKELDEIKQIMEKYVKQCGIRI